MAIEIERKFLLANDSWRRDVKKTVKMAQGYLGGTQCSVRVRVTENGAFLNIKSRELGISRQEFEYPIPIADAETLLRNFADSAAIFKTRHYVAHMDVDGAALMFEIDVFTGDNAGLVVAEVELASLDQQFVSPIWLGAEVTDDARYYNSNLVTLPFCHWR
jgi:adenylate cyclase